jgi:carboxypeptidase C (cathepsin A)
MRLSFSILLFGLSLCVTALGQEPKATDATTKAADGPIKTKKSDDVITSGLVTIEGKKISYQTTTGKIALLKDDGTPRATMFHVSYVRTDLDPSQRPVTFAFNGGPGSSAVWLHIGALGPRIIKMPGDGTLPVTPPARFQNNESSILDVSDLVFIDPVSTGYSRAEKDTKAAEFHGVNEDIEAVAEFIRLWITQNKRWGSPKYLLGESYGGIRAAGLAHFLQNRYAMSLNGVIMLSTLIDFQTLSPASGNDLAYQIFLPSYTTTALHHQVIKGDREALLERARSFAYGPYATALLKGHDLSAQEKSAVAQELAALTGLSPKLIEELDLRIDPTRFRGELLRDQKKVIGRFDGRVAWNDTDHSDASAEYDPSYSLAFGAFGTAMLDYLGQDLKWQEQQTYEILTSKVQPWRWGAENSYVNLSERLSLAMRDNPKLRVLIQCGHTDLATPPEGMLYSARHMRQLPADLRKNIRVAWYDGGHMFYLNPPDLKKMRADLVDFIAPPTR